ncbi:hypothetical protein [Oikeobacillus pervagus]|nr:hypothetical protein [Oikeobacillus pervagus]
MKKRMIILFLAGLIIFSVNQKIAVNAHENKNNVETIATYEEDVTGDGQKEIIELKGKRFEPDSHFYKHVWAEIDGIPPKKVIIEYEGGFEPEIQFVDLNHDGVKDLFYSSATGGSGGFYNYALHTLKDQKLKDIGLPDSLAIESSFEPNFKGKIQIPGMASPIIVDLQDRKQDYLRLGIYLPNGKLNEPTELMVLPIALMKPVKMNEGNGLEAYQQVSGAYHADGIGTVISKWSYEQGKWQLKETKWEES